MQKKLETAVVIAKLLCVFSGTSLLTLQTGLGQWAHDTTPPSNVQWVMVVGGSLGTGLTAAGAFLSSAFGNYMSGINFNGTGPISPSQPTTPTPATPALTIPEKDDTVKQPLRSN